MSDSELVQLLGDEGRRHPTSPDERRSKLIAISARVGVWGIIGGLCSIILGVILMILLITGFLSHAFLPPNSEWGD